MKKYVYPTMLIVLFIILTAVILPSDAIYGSNTDWLSQHAVLAETIRDACVEQHTLLPDWINLGSGSNGYQFSYYGFLRPDILIGCLFPQIPMVSILIGYMFFLYPALLCMAAKRRDFSVFRPDRKHSLSDCRMSFPYAPSDYVCQLSAVFNPCLSMH